MKIPSLSWHGFIDISWLIFLLMMFIYFWHCRRLTSQTTHWKKTLGRITSCELQTVGHSMWPKIEYVYQIEDKDYTGEYLFLDTAHNNPHSKYARNIAYRVANAYKKNEDIEVFYNPKRPEQAVLDTTIPRKINVILGCNVVLIVVQLAMMILPIVG